MHPRPAHILDSSASVGSKHQSQRRYKHCCSCVVCFKRKGSSTCRLCDDCKWVTLQIAHNHPQRMEKAGGQMFHAACSCTFLVAHRHVGLQNHTLPCRRVCDMDGCVWKCKSQPSQKSKSEVNMCPTPLYTYFFLVL